VTLFESFRELQAEVLAMAPAEDMAHDAQEAAGAPGDPVEATLRLISRQLLWLQEFAVVFARCADSSQGLPPRPGA
jgi:hypothetical protein